MTENLHGIAKGVEGIVSLEAGDLVVDIGCNDGTLLDGYQSRELAPPRLRPVRRGPLRDREGLRRRQRLLLRRGRCRALRRPKAKA